MKRTSLTLSILLLLFAGGLVGEEYINSVSWSSSSDMGMFSSNWIGTKRFTPKVSTNVRSATIGDLIIVTDQNGKEVKRFTVRKIAIEKEDKMCFLTWLNKRQPDEYLSIHKCRQS